MAKRKPSQWAIWIGHAVVGAAAAYVGVRIAKEMAADAQLAGLVSAVVAMIAHDQLDAPVAQFLTELQNS